MSHFIIIIILQFMINKRVTELYRMGHFLGISKTLLLALFQFGWPSPCANDTTRKMRCSIQQHKQSCCFERSHNTQELSCILWSVVIFEWRLFLTRCKEKASGLVFYDNMSGIWQWAKFKKLRRGIATQILDWQSCLFIESP